MRRCSSRAAPTNWIRVQPSAAEFARFWGETVAEIHQGRASRFGYVNIIQPWKVATNGTVHNALET